MKGENGKRRRGGKGKGIDGAKGNGKGSGGE